MRTPPDVERCTYQYADGRRCRSMRGHSIPFCPAHQRLAQQRRRGAGAEGPADSFANSMPPAAQEFLARARDYTPGSVYSINTLVEHVLQMVVDNKMSARTATACAQLFRLMLKAQPQVDKESDKFNLMLHQQSEIEAAQASAEAQSAEAADPAPAAETVPSAEGEAVPPLSTPPPTTANHSALPANPNEEVAA